MAGQLRQLNTRRLGLGAGLVLAVLAVHLLLADGLAQHAQGLSAVRDAMPPRIEVAYVREMVVTAPPPAPSPPPMKRRTALPKPVVRPASAPASEPPAEAALAIASAPAPEPTPKPVPEPASAAVPMAEPAASEAAASAPAFEWPVSTRMRYLLTGNVRGEVNGQAQVEWIRVGQRYQVHLDVIVGMKIAPLGSRRMSSDGDITPEGLAPRRYDQETKLAFNDPYRATVRFEGDRVMLATGAVVPRWPGSQDTASQFVQLSYLFATRPDQLRTGNSVEIPLAMPRNLTSWVYDVLQEETLYTPFGEVQAFHLKPRREPRAGGDMTTEIWIAPGLRYLPVRFLIRPDPESYFDLMLDRRPELAGPEEPPRRNPP